jgi:hypothetical protein
MPRGGKRAGAGRKPRMLHYDGQSIGKRALKVGQKCEVLWREAYKWNVAGMHWEGEKRPRAHKRIVRQVAAEFDETPRMVERRWKEYRRFEKDTDPDGTRGLGAR